MTQLKCAFVTGASVNYLPGLWALINSIKKNHANLHNSFYDILVAGYGLQGIEFPDFVKVFNVTEGDQVKETAIRRFKLAVEHADYYKAICLIDADTFITAGCNLFFELAANGFIVTGSNGMLIEFNDEYLQKYQIDLGKKDRVYAKFHTTTPIFLNRKNIDWFEVMLKKEDAAYFDDFTYLNLVGYAMGKDEKMICLPPYAFTGIHHWQLKPETAIIEKGGRLFSGTEELIYMIHGKWWEDGWRTDLFKVMERYLHLSGNEKVGWEKTKNAFKLSFLEFLKYCKIF